MKKIKIAVAVFATVLATVAFAKAEEIKVDFDGALRGSNSLNTYLAKHKNEPGNEQMKNIPEPKGVNPALSTEVPNPYKDRLVVLNELLKGLSPAESVEFMSTMLISGGKLIPQDYNVLVQKDMKKISEIMEAFNFPARNEANYPPVVVRQPMTLGELMRGLPEKVKEEFFGDMRLVNGAVASVKTNLLKKSLPGYRFNEILETIMPAKDAKLAHMIDEASCITWIVNDKVEKGVVKSCDSAEDSMCNSDTCK